MTISNQYFQCPYCMKYVGGPGKKVPKNIGKYKVKIIGEVNLVFQCQKCTKSFRIKMMGSPLLWDDMSVAEKKAFKMAEWLRRK